MSKKDMLFFDRSKMKDLSIKYMSFFGMSKKICLFNFRHVLFPPKTEPVSTVVCSDRLQKMFCLKNPTFKPPNEF